MNSSLTGMGIDGPKFSPFSGNCLNFDLWPALSLVHTSQMPDDIDQFNENRPTLGQCVWQPVQQNPAILSDVHAVKNSS